MGVILNSYHAPDRLRQFARGDDGEELFRFRDVSIPFSQNDCVNCSLPGAKMHARRVKEWRLFDEPDKVASPNASLLPLTRQCLLWQSRPALPAAAPALHPCPGQRIT